MLLAGALALGGCAMPATSGRPTAPAPAIAETRAPVTILVSIDGFRADYLDRGLTPVLSRLAAGGVSAAMRPSFPSITFPNHWTLVTGLVPDHHGIVGNTMEDPARPGEQFNQAAEDPFWWNGAEPIWVTAEKAGLRTATMFWPGGNVAWGGVKTDAKHYPIQGGTRPSDWEHFDAYLPGETRVATVLDWLARPATNRPRFVTLYFEMVDSLGHDFGPDSPEVARAIATVDRQIGALVAGLAAMGQPANLVIVADHGMAARSNDRVVLLDRIARPEDFRTLDTGAMAAIYPTPGHEATLERALLAPHDHLRCWRKGDLPARFHYGTNPRVAPYVCLADVGWEVLKTAPKQPVAGGDHGYDNDAPEMRALFIANGPAFRHGVRLPTFDNTAVAPLLRDLLGLPPGTGLDGSDAPFRGAMKRWAR